MSALLHSLGRWCAQHAARVLALWLVVVAALGGLVGATGVNLSSAFTINDVESMEGLDVLANRLPQAAGTSEQVLFTAQDGDIEAHRATIDGFIDAAGALEGVAAVTHPFGSEADTTTATPASSSTVSDDGAHVLAQVQADASIGSLTSGAGTGAAQRLSADLADLIETTRAADPGLAIQSSGTIGATVSLGIGPQELVGVVIAFVVLLLTFGSVLVAGAPLVAAFFGVATGMLGILAVANTIDVNSVTPVLAVMIGLAVGIDYALFIISRAREYLAGGVSGADAAGRATATAGSAVVFAGTTVIVALCGLAVARIPFLTTMGIASAAVVACAVLVSLTVVPALIGLLGERLRPRRRAARSTSSRPGAATRWVRGVTRHPWLSIAAVVALLAVAAVPVTGLRLALTDNGFEPKGTQARDTYDAIAEAYGDGYNSPIIVIADITTSTDPLGVVEDLSQRLEAIDGVDDVAMATPNQDATLALVQIRPTHGQADERTEAVVHTIRDRAAQWQEELGTTHLMVTGQTAVAIDVAESLNSALLPFGLVVVGLSLLLLMVVFRSLAVPVTATLGYLGSLAAGMGVAGAVFGWGWLADPLGVTKVGAVISFMPVIVMGVLFGLAMDYEVFLVSRMREEWIHGGGPAAVAAGRHDEARAISQRAVETGFTGSATVVGAAAVIMTAVFAGFIPAELVQIKPIAIALTVGIAVDAFVVRMTLIPALMSALGPRAWWLPRWLERQLPVIDVEGEGLARTLEHEAWTAEHGEVVLRADGVSATDADGAALAGLDLTLAPGEVALVRTSRSLSRRALAALVGGRLQPSGGVLVVGGHVLPDGTAAIQSVTTAVHAYDDPVDPRVRLVVVDDPGQRRWGRVARLAADGTAVIVTVGAEAPLAPPAGCDVEVTSLVDVDADGTAHLFRAPSRASDGPQTTTRTATEETEVHA
ncbi:MULTISPECIES: MMPL family transporter [unclassified Actinomyces]|uniref:MMPL family transporter n=1 Tax=unclassified Actinomyces TaxID=2609248 RepID=UPI002017B2D6|nr:MULTISPECIES: MMPL family transporter [unclassified Actinomyces]MCL3777338.1 MMPL family transporter [Actinomyces sp. AC-20-1]MCL3789638.1 MMPL family transporter [Actinomyces sp. 187325]MCL3793031.1 MMPL family transporter [Actinomyces sp. 186855]MCL3794956.1 MMPL family transporter [Actinomyces sp. 217892]